VLWPRRKKARVRLNNIGPEPDSGSAPQRGGLMACRAMCNGGTVFARRHVMNEVRDQQTAAVQREWDHEQEVKDRKHQCDKKY